ncbi:MAG: signal peptide peptidase SppA [Pseudomonadota bacterium]
MSETSAISKMFRYLWLAIDGFRKLLHLALLLVLFSVLLLAIPSEMPRLPQQAALVIKPTGVLVDELSGDAFDRAMAELQGSPVRETLVRDIVAALDAARDDPNVPGVVLELGALSGGGLTKLYAVGDAVRRFRESGKPVYAYSGFYSQGSYLIASQADEVWMDPNGGVFLSGFGNYRAYYREAIDKLSIDWNVFRAGSYKSFGEPYTRNDMSPESREASLAWLNDLWGLYLTGVSEARGVEAASLERLADTLGAALSEADGNWATMAVDVGLVDRLVTPPAKRAALASEFGADDDGEGSYNGIAFETYLANRQLQEPAANERAKIAVVVASGPVVNGEAPPGQIGGDSTAALIRAARLDDEVQALVLRVDSGGGSVFASDVIQAEIAAFKATDRPYVASMGSVAASAGYWLAASADRIYASPATITGSIGVIGMFPTFQRSLDRLGIHIDGVGTSGLAGQFRPDTAMSDEARLVIQQLIQADYDRFIGGVAEFRGMEVSAVDAIAQGRVWSGEDAIEIGLIDEFGEIDVAVQAAADLAGLEPGSYRTAYVEPPRSPFEDWLVQLAQTGARIGVYAPEPRDDLFKRASDWLANQATWLASLNDPKGSYSICFCVVR